MEGSVVKTVSGLTPQRLISYLIPWIHAQPSFPASYIHKLVPVWAAEIQFVSLFLWHSQYDSSETAATYKQTKATIRGSRKLHPHISRSHEIYHNFTEITARIIEHKHGALRDIKLHNSTSKDRWNCTNMTAGSNWKHKEIWSWNVVTQSLLLFRSISQQWCKMNCSH